MSVYLRFVFSGLGCRILKVSSSDSVLANSICTTAVASSKHWNQKFRKLRSMKVIKVDLPIYEESKKQFDELSKEEMRSLMKEKGVLPSVPFTEKPLYVSSLGAVIEPYVPPEGDGKMSFVSKEGVKQKLDFASHKGKSFMALRKLRKNDDDFEIPEFLIEAQDIYLKAHNAMMNVRNDKEELQRWVTEKAYPEMLHNAIDKTIHWKMIGLLEHPRLVQARTTEMISKENLFSQLTVRFHTQQMLAVYDRFGRLMYGSEILAKDVLEYIVYEKHLSHKYGTWRIHAKIIPDWMPPKDPVTKTYRILPEEEEELPPPPTTEKSTEGPSTGTPALATA